MDRVDALVWALTSLTEGGAPEFIFADSEKYLAPPKPNMNLTVKDMLMNAREIKL